MSRSFGLFNAIKLIFLTGRSRSKRNIVLETERGTIRFSFRCGMDNGVISHFYKDGFGFDDRSAPIRRIIDCGANIGDETLRFALRHPEAEILAVEADPDNFKILESNFSDVRGVKTVHAAVWSDEGFVNIKKSTDGNPEASSVEAAERSGDVRSHTVTTLMEMMGWDRVDVIKFDVEGAEYHVFNSDTAWVDHVKAIVFEVPDSDHPGTLQLIFNRISHIRWRGRSIGECLVLVREDSQLSAVRVEGL